MKNFESRRDRFNFFESFEKPLLNMTFRLEVPNFLPLCKKKDLPPFHFFLFHVSKSLSETQNFRYRLHNGQVIMIERIVPSYTTMSVDNLFNYTHLEYTPDLQGFIQRSLSAKEEVANSRELKNVGFSDDPRLMKDYFFITSIPWLDFTAIEHPVYKFRSNDIPSIAWGKFQVKGDVIEMPFAVQAHHGFVDAYHIHLLAEAMKANIKETIAALDV